MEQYQFLGTFDLRGHVLSPPGFKMTGGSWKVRQDYGPNLQTGARLDPVGPEGSIEIFQVIFDDEAEASFFRAYCADKYADQEDLNLHIRSAEWYFQVWGINLRQLPIGEAPLDYMLFMYEVACYLYSPFSFSRISQVWRLTNISLPQTQLVGNGEGHYPASFDSLAITCHYASASHVKVLTLVIEDSLSLILTNEALSDERWELQGNRNQLLETYYDPMVSGAVWGHDVTGSGTFDTDHIELNNGQSAYYKLHGPNAALYPVKMTANLSLDAGGTTGLAYVEISPDGSNWYTALTQDDFESGLTEYYLNGTEKWADIYVRFRNASGTSGKNLNIKTMKFEVIRWIAEAEIPVVAAGDTKTATLSAGTGSQSVNISGTFLRKHLLV
jgi:hypothetical protein